MCAVFQRARIPLRPEAAGDRVGSRVERAFVDDASSSQSPLPLDDGPESLHAKFTERPLAARAGGPTIGAMEATRRREHSNSWRRLPGLFSWSEVVYVIERSLEVAKRRVRASLAPSDPSGLLYHVFVTDAAP